MISSQQPNRRKTVHRQHTKVLGRIRQPLLPHINVHRPVQKLIRLCGEVLAAPTENEEIQFLCIVCSKLKQDPYLVDFFLEVQDAAGRVLGKGEEGDMTGVRTRSGGLRPQASQAAEGPRSRGGRGFPRQGQQPRGRASPSHPCGTTGSRQPPPRDRWR
ncbi:hypothetical protein CRUP_028589 [Coryphaenoides rupestris]|nr:hypothetical protein CRUP_028589 [Coryphaenoides rupestris]